MGPSTSSPPARDSPAQIVLRNALRYTISAKEYTALHRYLITRSPLSLRKRAPTPHKFDSIVKTKDDYNTAAVRASLRVFLVAQTSLKLWDIVLAQLRGRGKRQKFAIFDQETRMQLTKVQL